MIQFDGVKKVYEGAGKSPDILALDNVNLHIKKGEFVFVLGHSGAGKSTFLKLILREEKATQGQVVVNGINLSKIRQRNIPYFRRQLGVVFQDFRLIPTMTAYHNVAFAMRVTNIPERQIKRRVPYVLNLVGLTGKANSFPHELSGGEQQRIALARALVHSPPLIIADEPTGNIDPELSVEIMELLQAINSVGTTVVVVTHERDLAMRFQKRIITIDHGQVLSDTPALTQSALRNTKKSSHVQPPLARVTKQPFSSAKKAQISQQKQDVKESDSSSSLQKSKQSITHPITRQKQENVDDIIDDLRKKKAMRTAKESQEEQK